MLCLFFSGRFVIELIQWQGLLSKLLLKLGWNQIVMAILQWNASDINSKWCPEVLLLKCCATCKLQLDWICLYFLWSQFYPYQRLNIPIFVQNIYGIDIILLYIHQTRILFLVHPIYFLSVQLLPPTLQTIEFLFLSWFIYLCIDVDMLRY